MYRNKILSGVIASALFVSYTGSPQPVFSEQNIKSESSPVTIPDRTEVFSIKNTAVVKEVAIRVNMNPPIKKPVVKEIEIPSDIRCQEYYLLAKEVGWPESQLERLDYVMWRESRCDSSVHNKKDPSGGSRGLIQINGYWCRPNRFTDHGFLQDNDVLETCDQLFDPRINLTAGLAMYNYGIETSGCGWRPWSTKKNKWC